MKMIISPLLSYICVINLLLISIIGYQRTFVNPLPGIQHPIQSEVMRGIVKGIVIQAKYCIQEKQKGVKKMIKWEAVKQPATDEDIQHIEDFVGKKLPGDYVELAKVYHGSVPGVCIDVDGEPYPFDQLLSVSKEDGEEEDFCHVIGAYRHMYLDENSDPTLPEGFVPFALDGQNKWYCFDYRESTESPAIVLINWEAHYEDDPDYVVTFIKESFNELLESLYEL